MPPLGLVGWGSITDRKLILSSVPSIAVLQDPEKDNKDEMVKLNSTERNEKNKTDDKSKQISTKKSFIIYW